MLNDRDWREDALCASPENRKMLFTEKDIWFHLDNDDPEYDPETDGPEQVALDEQIAKGICMQCPVRDTCLIEMLEDQHVSGTRGGLTEAEARQALSIDETGKEVRRGVYPVCPFCSAPTAKLLPTKVELPEGGRWSEAKAVRCDNCMFEWKSRSSHNAVVAFQREVRKRAEQARREQIARERQSK